MPILPGTTSYDELGGTLNNYSDIVDPTTDLPDTCDNKTRAIVAGLTRLAPRIFVQWTNDGTDGTVEVFDSVVGNNEAYWPTFSKTATGQWRLTFPASVTDALGATQDWSFRYGDGDLAADTPGKVQVKRFSPNVIDVYLWDMTVAPPAASNLASKSIIVRVY